VARGALEKWSCRGVAAITKSALVVLRESVSLIYYGCCSLEYNLDCYIRKYIKPVQSFTPSISIPDLPLCMCWLNWTHILRYTSINTTVHGKMIRGTVMSTHVAVGDSPISRPCV
jgi:hypothetical protein